MKITNFKYFFIGFILGILIVAVSWNYLFKAGKTLKEINVRETVKQAFRQVLSKAGDLTSKKIVEVFSEPITAEAGKSFGKQDQLTFELFRDGTFVIDGSSGYAWQRSDSYRDSAWIRSTDALPRQYKVGVLVGGIDYGLEKISGLPDDPEYPKGPKNENGCYFLVIADTKPEGHYINDWWHHHRKVGVDVDNNVWGYGMPRPVFMVYSDKNNDLFCIDGVAGTWSEDWVKAFTYEPGQWYWVEIEKTRNKYNLSVRLESGKLLRSASVDIKNVWHGEGDYDEYFVIGDPHENYYQGSMKIKEISMRY